MTLPTDAISLIDWGATFLIPIIIGWIVSRFLEGKEWFQNVEAKNAIVLAVSALLGMILSIVKMWLIQNPDALAALDEFIKPLLSALVIYLSTQVTHGADNAKKRSSLKAGGKLPAQP